ncbi:MAG: DUF2333 family protein [Saccharospirillum sp.]
MAEPSIKARLFNVFGGLRNRLPASRWLRVLVLALLALLLVLIVLGMYWSRSPGEVNVVQMAEDHARTHDRELVVGYTTTYTLHFLVDTLLTKPGGYLSNDVTPPSWWLDNMPNWEFGVLTQARDLSRAMRRDMSRSQSQSAEDPDLARAEPLFHFDNSSWILPASEREYRRGADLVNNYLMRLSDPTNSQAQFYARADNLRQWLNDIETRLGSLSQRLSASVGEQRVNTDLASDPAARQSTPANSEQYAETPWLEVDDIFYEARGSAWALLHIMKAVEQDFGAILDNRNARASVQQIIRELELTQRPMRSPIVMNGSGYGVFANHSLVMANYISRANAAISDLRELLGT